VTDKDIWNYVRYKNKRETEEEGLRCRKTLRGWKSVQHQQNINRHILSLIWCNITGALCWCDLVC